MRLLRIRSLIIKYRQTASTFEAAATFFQLVNIWGPADAETQEKIKYAKWNAARILKAIKEGKDPNESNPKQEVRQEDATPDLDPNDPEVQAIGAVPRPVSMEDAPDDDGRLHPTSGAYQTFPAPVSAPTSPAPPSALAPEQVSPLVPPGPPTREPGSYFPDAPGAPDGLNLPSTTNMPPPGPNTYNAMGPPPSIPNPSSHDPSAPPSLPSVPQDFYRPTPPPATAPPPVKMPQPRDVPPQAPAASHSYYSQPAQPPAPRTAPPPTAPAQQYTGAGGGPSNPYNADDIAILQAQKHAKWAISALNFEDVSTAVRELQAALASLGVR